MKSSSLSIGRTAFLRLCTGTGILVLVCAASHSYAQTNFMKCSRLGNYFYSAKLLGHMALRPSSAGVSSDPNDWQAWPTYPSNVPYMYDRAWQSYWYMDTSNKAVWVDWSSPSSCNNSGGLGTVHCLRRQADHTSQGTAYVHYPWTGGIYDVDMTVRNATALHYVCEFASDPSLCVEPPVFGRECNWQFATEEATVVHELGHAYGYAHFDDWLSTMNTSQFDVTGCEYTGSQGDYRARPSSEATVCHDKVYGLIAGNDIAVTSLVQTAPLATNMALVYSPFVYERTVSSSTTFVTFDVDATIMNQRDDVGYTVINIWMSADHWLNGPDQLIATQNVFPMVEGYTGDYTVHVSFNPQSAMPVIGQQYYVLYQVDGTNSVSETVESNNVTETHIAYRRL